MFLVGRHIFKHPRSLFETERTVSYALPSGGDGPFPEQLNSRVNSVACSAVESTRRHAAGAAAGHAPAAAPAPPTHGAPRKSPTPHCLSHRADMAGGDKADPVHFDSDVVSVLKSYKTRHSRKHYCNLAAYDTWASVIWNFWARQGAFHEMFKIPYLKSKRHSLWTSNNFQLLTKVLTHLGSQVKTGRIRACVH